MSFYKMHRGWMNSEVFKKEPYTQREAWCWLVENARYKDDQKPIFLSGKEIFLQRGQLTHSTRFLAEIWGWPQTTVRRVLKVFEKWLMIRCESGSGQNLITICNYEQYQDISEDNGSETAQECSNFGSKTAQSNKKGKKEKKENKYSSDFLEFWEEYPSKIAKPKAFQIYQRVIDKRETTHIEIMEGLTEYKKHLASNTWKKPAHPTTWLGQGRWGDDHGTKPQQMKIAKPKPEPTAAELFGDSA